MQGKIERISQISLFLLGMTTLAGQLLIFRQFLTIFSGNDLIIGMLMSCWLIITAAGAFLSRFFSRGSMTSLVVQQVVLTLVSIITYYSIPIIKTSLFPLGIVPGLFQTLGIFLLVLALFCFLGGMLFPVLAKLLSERFTQNMAHRAYAAESFGSIAGGLMVSICLWYFFDVGTIFLLIVIVNWVGALAILVSQKRKIPALITTLLCILAGWLSIGNSPEKMIFARIFPQQEVVRSIDSPLGSIRVVRYGEELTISENGEAVATTFDVAKDEEKVHWAMLTHPKPEDVLLIGTSSPGMFLEILKYPVSRIDYVEMNRWLYNAIALYMPYTQDKRILNHFTDPRRFVKKTLSRYDVVLVNMPPPYSAGINRFYTLEFIEDIRAIMKEGAVVQFILPASGNYLSEDAKLLNSSIYQGLKSTFKNVRIIPSSCNFFLASDRNLELDIIERIQNQVIPTIYFNEYYIDERAIHDRAILITELLQDKVVSNQDLRPITYYYYLKYWTSMMKFNGEIIAYCLVGAVILLILFLPATHSGIFTAGFSAAAYELLLISAIQLLYGYVYQLIAVVFTLFMAGMAWGALKSPTTGSVASQKRFLVVQLVLGAFGILLQIMLQVLQAASASPFWVWLVMGAMTLLAGWLMGKQFALGNAIIRGNAVAQASGTYSVDLLGSAGGAMLASLLLIPVLGIIPASQSIAALNAVTALVIVLKWRRTSP